MRARGGDVRLDLARRPRRAAGRAREVAAGPRGPLCGVPFAVKDNIDVAGVPTTAALPAVRLPAGAQRRRGAAADGGGRAADRQDEPRPVRDRPGRHALAVRRVLERVRSAPVVGRLELGLGAWPSARASSRSRSAPTPPGPGACRRPSTAIVGVKPTRGLVSTAGVVPACRSLDCVSVFAADVAERAARARGAGRARSRRPVLARRRARPRGRRRCRCGSACPRSRERSTWPRRPGSARSRRGGARRRARRGRPRPVPGGRAHAVRRARGSPSASPSSARRSRAAAPDVDPVVREIVLDGARWTAVDAFRAPHASRGCGLAPGRRGSGRRAARARPRRSIRRTTRSPPTRSA